MISFKKLFESNWNKPFTQDEENIESHLHKKLSNHYTFTGQNVDPLRNYTSSTGAGSSGYINNHLWSKHMAKHNDPYISDPDHMLRRQFNDDFLKPTIENIDKLLNHHKTPHNLTVYSGIHEDHVSHFTTKGLIHHPTYLSTSLNKSIARGFGKKENGDYHVLKINVPKGHVGAYMGHFSKFEKEREFLLPRGINFKHKGTIENIITQGNHKDQKVYEHHMEMV